MNQRIFTPLILVSVLLFGWLPSLSANENQPRAVSPRLHPISIIEADIYVNRFKTTMRLKMFADDLQLFQGLEADETGMFIPDEIRAAIKAHKDFLADRIKLIDADGVQLKGVCVEIAEIKIPEEGIDSGQLMNYQLGYIFEYKYDKPPEFLTLQQEVVDDDYAFPSELKALVKQAGAEKGDPYNLKPEEPKTLRFDWSRAPVSEEASKKEWEEWFEEERKKTLGITSYSSVYSFIYINNHEVRNEVLIPLASMKTVVNMESKDPLFMEIEEQDAAAELIKKYFSKGNPVFIDGVQVKPVFDRIDFYGLDLRDFAQQAERRKVSMANGRVGLIISYSTKGRPQQVKMKWTRFSAAINDIQSIVFAYDKTEKFKFSRYLKDNTFEWNNPGTPPLPEITKTNFEDERVHVSLVSVIAAVVGAIALLAGLLTLLKGGRFARFAMLAVVGIAAAVAAFPTYSLDVYPVDVTRFFRTPMNDDEAKPIFERLHKNLFRAFDYREDDDVYDALQASVDGPLLRELYQDVKKTLVMQEQGGARSRIDEVKILEGGIVEPISDTELDPLGFAYRCKWRLVGTIEHWGHIHERSIDFDAIFHVEPREDSWKITAKEIVDESQSKIKLSLRKF